MVAATAFLYSNEVAIVLHCHSKQALPIASSTIRATIVVKHECSCLSGDRTSKQLHIADYPTIVIILFNKMADVIITERSLADLGQYQKFSYSSLIVMVAIKQLSYDQVGYHQQMLWSCILVDIDPMKRLNEVLQQLRSPPDKLDMPVNVNMQQI